MEHEAKQLFDMLVAARKALDTIVRLDEADCVRYVAKADSIALDALIALDLALDDAGLSLPSKPVRSCA